MMSREGADIISPTVRNAILRCGSYNLQTYNTDAQQINVEARYLIEPDGPERRFDDVGHRLARHHCKQRSTNAN
jgi:hypothetical protein